MITKYKFLETQSEENQIVEIINKLNQNEALRGFYWQEEAIKEELKASSCYIASFQNKVAAFLAFRKISGVGEITVLATDPSDQGKGLMRGLINYVFDAEPGIKEWWLEVSEFNLNAIHLYEKLGFLHTGTRKGYYRDGSSARNYTLIR